MGSPSYKIWLEDATLSRKDLSKGEGGWTMMQCAKEVTSQYTRLGGRVQRYRGDDDLIRPIDE